jgi:hypothetical protein
MGVAVGVVLVLPNSLVAGEVVEELVTLAHKLRVPLVVMVATLTFKARLRVTV